MAMHFRDRAAKVSLVAGTAMAAAKREAQIARVKRIVEVSDTIRGRNIYLGSF